jgi:hypothetical protein
MPQADKPGSEHKKDVENKDIKTLFYVLKMRILTNS